MAPGLCLSAVIGTMARMLGCGTLTRTTLRRIKKIYKKGRATYKDASAVISYLGWIKHSDSHFYFMKYIKPYINIKKLKEVVRNENRKQFRANNTL